MKVESCRACDCALRSLGGRFSLGTRRLTLAGRTLTRMCFQNGLKVHMGKTVMLTNDGTRPAALRCGGHDVRVLQHGQSEKYLGRKFSVDSYHDTELQHRLGCGWAAFAKHKFILCNRRIPLKDRMRLFQASIAPFRSMDAQSGAAAPTAEYATTDA